MGRGTLAAGRGVAAVVVTLMLGCTDLGGLSNGKIGDAGAVDGGALSDAALGDASADGTNADAPSVPPDAGVDGGAAFLDDFNRPDGPDIGNGWICKQAGTFLLIAGAVERQQSGATDYRDNICYRPSAEDVRDVEVSVEFKLGAPPGYPQLHLRVQSATVGTPNVLDGYLFFMAGDPGTAVLARQNGAVRFTTLQTLAVLPAIDTTNTYRLRLRATGSTSVTLAAFLEKRVGTAWQSLAQATFVDTSATRIDTAGSVGFSAGVPEVTGNYVYDNFTRTPL